MTRAAEVGSSANGSGGRPRRVLPPGRAYGLGRGPGILQFFFAQRTDLEIAKGPTLMREPCAPVAPFNHLHSALLSLAVNVAGDVVSGRFWVGPWLEPDTGAGAYVLPALG